MSGIRVLIVDDSMLFREMLSRGLLRCLPSGSAISKAGDPFEARDKILAFEPDVMLLDVEMPKMDGVEFLRRLLMQYPQPTVMLSGSPEYRERALAAGAVDYMVKPECDVLRPDSRFFADLAARLCAAAVKGLVPRTAPVRRQMQKKLIAIGASTGGTEALASVLTALRPPLPGIVIVQHIPPMFSRLFAERLDHECRLQVKEGETGDVVRMNHVYIAPGNKHMKLVHRGYDFVLDCSTGERVNGHCPSVDVLFRSVASLAGDTAVGVILTGMGSDGAKGLLEMRQAGAATLGQDARSCVVYGMPKAAWDIGAVERQLPLEAIAGAISSMVR